MCVKLFFCDLVDKTSIKFLQNKVIVMSTTFLLKIYMKVELKYASQTM